MTPMPPPDAPVRLTRAQLVQLRSDVKGYRLTTTEGDAVIATALALYDDLERGKGGQDERR